MLAFMPVFFISKLKEFNMTAKAIQYRRGNTAEHSLFTGLNGEITVDTDKKVAVIHDGQTAGGLEMARADMDNVSQASLLAKIGNINVDTSNLADIDLSNLSATGQAIIGGKASIDATNFTTTGKSTLSGLCMPSDTYINLTLGVSGSTYTAPANGYFYFCKLSSTSGQYFVLTNTATSEYISNKAYSGSMGLNCLYPVKAGTIISLSYDLAGVTEFFRFYYNQGEI